MPIASGGGAANPPRRAGSDARAALLALLVSALALAVAVSPAAASTWFVSPGASASGVGSAANPWTLRQALSGAGGAIQPGDTVYLRGGTYQGKVTATVRGTSLAPIVIQSAPGEWARIDGNESISLTAPVAATDTSIALSSTGFASPGASIVVDTEMMYVTGSTAGALHVIRAWSGTTAAPHAVGAAVVVVGSIVTVNGPYVWFRDLEVFSSDPVRQTAIAGSSPIDVQRGEGFSLAAAGVKLINVVVHDAGDAIGFWTGATDSELYGVIAYSNGWQGPDRGHGHGLYIQNQTGDKYVTDVVSFDNYATGMKTFGYAAYGNNVHYDGVTVFGNHEGNFFVGMGSNPSHGITVDHLLVYAPPTANGGGGVTLGWSGSGTANEDVALRDSYIAGRTGGVAVSDWNSATVTGNTILVWGNSGADARMASARPNPGVPFSAFTWDRNTYVDGDVPFSNGLTYIFGAAGGYNALGGGNQTYDEPIAPNGGRGWREWTAFDASSTYVKGAPSGTRVFVRPNRHEAGRATITIFNWDGNAGVDVDVSSVLCRDDAFEVVDAQNYFGVPVAAGTYDGAPIRLPMVGLPVYTAVGNVAFPPAHTSAEFGVFVLRRTRDGGCAVAASTTISVPTSNTVGPVSAAVTSTSTTPAPAVTASPAVASWQPGRLDVFIRGPDDTLRHQFFQGAWSDWENLGGLVGSDPGVVSWGPGRLDVVVRGADGAIWHLAYEGGWSGWESLGGTSADRPVVTSWGPGRLDVFVRGTDDQLWHKFYDGTWSPWEPLGGVIVSAPAAVSWGAGRIDVFARGADNGLYHRIYDRGWRDWQGEGGILSAAPAVSSWGVGRLDVFVRGSDGMLWHEWFDNGAASGAWENLGDAISTPPSAVSWGPSRIDLFAVRADGTLVHKSYAGGWSAETMTPPR